MTKKDCHSRGNGNLEGKGWGVGNGVYAVLLGAVSIPLEVVRSLTRPLQCLLGYTTASIMLGQVERRNPIHWFD